MSAYCVIAFHSTHSAIFAEKSLKAQFPVVIMPTPRVITASCGIALRFPPALYTEVFAAMSALPVPPESWTIYRIGADGALEASDGVVRQ